MKSKLFSRGYLFIIAVILASINVYELKKDKNTIAAKQEGLSNYLVLPSMLLSEVDFESNLETNANQEGDLLKIPKQLPNLLLSLILFPFFIIAHLIALTFNLEASGYSPPYLYLLHFANLFFSLIGIYFLFKLLSHFFNYSVAAITLLLIVFGTNFFAYTTTFVGYANTLNFSLITAFIYFSINHSSNNNRKVFLSILYALIAVLNPINALVLFVPLLVNYNTKKPLIQQLSFFLKQYKLAIFLFFLIVTLSSLYLQWALSAIPENYSKGKYFLTNPHVYAALLEYRKGWLIYSPIMIFALIGLISLAFVKVIKRRILIGGIIYIAIYIYITFSYWNWWYTESFSQRMMIDTYAFFALGLAYLVHLLLKQKQFIYHFWAMLLAAFFIYLNQFQTYQFKKGLITSNNMTENAFWAVFGETEKPRNFDCHLAKVDFRAAYSNGETKFTSQRCDNAKQLSAERLKDYKKEGSRNYAKNGVYIFGKEKEIGVSFKSIQNATGLSVSLDENDSYELTIYRGAEQLEQIVLKNNKEIQGLRVYEVNLSKETAKAGFDYIKVKPIEGDDFYAIGHLILSSQSAKNE